MEMEKLGFRFHPSDADLLRILILFLTGEYEEDEGVVQQRNVYGEKEPWHLFLDQDNNVSYFFTQLQRKAKNGKSFLRSVGGHGGTWHGRDRGHLVFGKQDGRVLGYKRSFVYKNANEPEHNGQWLMKEFYLSDNVINNGKIFDPRKDFVICRLKRKRHSSGSDDQVRNPNVISSWGPIKEQNAEDGIQDFIDRALLGETNSNGPTPTCPKDIIAMMKMTTEFDELARLALPGPVVEEYDDMDMLMSECFDGVEVEDYGGSQLQSSSTAADVDPATFGNIGKTDDDVQWLCDLSIDLH